MTDSPERVWREGFLEEGAPGAFAPGAKQAPRQREEGLGHRSGYRLGKRVLGLGVWGPGRLGRGLSSHSHVRVRKAPRAHREPGLLTLAHGGLGAASGLFLLPGIRKWGETAHILKGEIISLLPVLGKIIRSQKCLLVTPFVERHFGTTRWKNQNAFHKMICVKYAS